MKTDKLTAIIMKSNHTVFFGGAGVSTASGIPDFRSAEGIYSQSIGREFGPEELISHTFYERYPELFFSFYKEKLVYPNAKPNACHTALSKLEQMHKLASIVTQNIDGLHQQAGSQDVIELHGSVHRNYCEECGAFYGVNYILSSPGVPLCERCGGRIKPDVVLYEEPLRADVIEKAIDEIQKADTLIVGGTSLVVYPAAGLIRYFTGENIVLINKSATAIDTQATLVINENIAEVFHTVMCSILENE